MPKTKQFSQRKRAAILRLFKYRARKWLRQKWNSLSLARWKGDLPFHQHADYTAATEFRKNFTPLEGDEHDYDWVTDFAKFSYEKIHDGFDKLDEKADSIIRYLGGGSALVV